MPAWQPSWSGAALGAGWEPPTAWTPCALDEGAAVAEEVFDWASEATSEATADATSEATLSLGPHPKRLATRQSDEVEMAAFMPAEYASGSIAIPARRVNGGSRISHPGIG